MFSALAWTVHSWRLFRYQMANRSTHVDQQQKNSRVVVCVRGTRHVPPEMARLFLGNDTKQLAKVIWYWHRCEHVIWRRGCRTGSAIIPLGRAMLSSYSLSIVGPTIPLSVMVWLQFALQCKFWHGFRLPNLLFVWEPCTLSNHTSVPAKWHLLPSNSFSMYISMTDIYGRATLR